MAAGLIMVREAGGFVTDLDGGDAMFWKGNVVAGNETMHGSCCACSRGRQVASAQGRNRPALRGA